MMRVLHVLIVDDEPWNLELAETVLKLEGHRVSTAADGEEAVAMCEAEAYDAVLMDVYMPHMDGFTATRRLRQSSEVPVIFLTGSTDRQDEREAREAGGDYFMTKPYKRDELLAVIKRVLEARGVLAPSEGITR